MGSHFFKLVEKEENKIALEPENIFPVYPTASIAKFAPKYGQTAIIIDELGVHMIDMKEKKEKLMILRNGIGGINFSPLDTYLITCEKFTQGEKNLMIWNMKSGKEEAQFEWKKTSKEGPRSLKFTKDE